MPGSFCWVICAALRTAWRNGEWSTCFSYSSRRTQSGLYSRIRAGSNPMRRVSNRVTK